MDPDNNNKTNSDSLVDSKLGQYRIVASLGRGGMSSVYRAHDPMLDREVAVKILPQAPDADHADLEAGLIQEARTAAKLKHPNVVTIYQVGEDKGHFFMAMELVEGGSLAQRLKREGKLDAREAASLVQQAAAALDAANMLSLVHGDIKPSNLMLDPDGTLKIADFGLARLVAGIAEESGKTAVMGTPLYLAPELCLGGEATHATDLYALGCTLFQLVTGQPPFSAKSLRDLLKKHVDDPPPDPTKLNISVPPELREIIHRCLAKEPSDRYETAEGLVSDLKGFLDPSKAGPRRSTEWSALAQAAKTSRKAPANGLSAQKDDKSKSSSRPSAPPSGVRPSGPPRPNSGMPRPGIQRSRRPAKPHEGSSGLSGAISSGAFSPSAVAGLPSAVSETEQQENGIGNIPKRILLIVAGGIGLLILIVILILILRGSPTPKAPETPPGIGERPSPDLLKAGAQARQRLDDLLTWASDADKNLVMDELQSITQKWPDTQAGKRAEAYLQKLQEGQSTKKVFPAKRKAPNAR